MPKYLRTVAALAAAFVLLIHIPDSGPWVSAADIHALRTPRTHASARLVPSEGVESRTVLSDEQAAELAEFWIASKADQIPTWRDGKAGRPTQYYNLDGWPAARVFAVLRGLRSVGYVVVRYEVSDQPILEFGTGPPPHSLCASACRSAAANQGMALATDRPIYLGPLGYYFEAIDPSPAKNEGQRMLVHMSGAHIEKVPSQPTRPLPEEKTATSALASNFTAEVEPIRKIYGVPDYGQFFGPSLGYSFPCLSGCTPTAATNIAHFWADAGYPNLGDAYWPDTTVDLRSRMETLCYGTTGTTLLHKTAPAMVAFSQARGYSFQSLQYCWPADQNWVGCDHREFTWQRYTEEIDACRPALISISNHPLYGNHSVTGIGYDTSGGSFYIVHDNWTSTPREVWIQHENAEDRPRFLFPLVPPAMDQTPPNQVQIAPLPPYQADTKFDVSWDGTDAFPGVGSFDVQFRDHAHGDWQYWLRGTQATDGRLNDDVELTGGHVYSVRVRARDKHCNESDWSTSTASAADAAPPITAVAFQPRYRTGDSFPVAWDGTDDAAGIDRFDIWVNSGNDDWSLWQTSHSAASQVFTNTVVGTTYDFISIGTDRLGRQEAKDPASPDTKVTLARHSIGGVVTGNGGQPVYRASLGAPEAYITDTTGIRGQYTLFFPHSQAVTLTISAPPGFGTLPPVKDLRLTETMTDLNNVNLVLPPADNLLLDSHFEEADPSAHWILSGVVTPAHTLLAHSGDFGITLGTLPSTLRTQPNPERTTGSDQVLAAVWAISQTVDLSPTLSQPTLSWFYTISGTAGISDALVVDIQGPTASMTVPLSLGSSGWTHGSMILDEALIGDAVTVSLSLRRETILDGLTLLLDEVTLGSRHEGPTRLFLPLIQH